MVGKPPLCSFSVSESEEGSEHGLESRSALSQPPHPAHTERVFPYYFHSLEKERSGDVYSHGTLLLKERAVFASQTLFVL